MLQPRSTPLPPWRYCTDVCSAANYLCERKSPVFWNGCKTNIYIKTTTTTTTTTTIIIILIIIIIVIIIIIIIIIIM